MICFFKTQTLVKVKHNNLFQMGEAHPVHILYYSQKFFIIHIHSNGYFSAARIFINLDLLTKKDKTLKYLLTNPIFISLLKINTIFFYY